MNVIIFQTRVTRLVHVSQRVPIRIQINIYTYIYPYINTLYEKKKRWEHILFLKASFEIWLKNSILSSI